MSKPRSPDTSSKARGAVPPAGGRPAAEESVAGEEDPGSALEQFSDLMHGTTPHDDKAGDSTTAPAVEPTPRAGGVKKP